MAQDEAERAGIRKLDGSPNGRRWRDTVTRYAETRITTLTDAVAIESLRAATAGYYGGYYGKLWQLDMMTRQDVRINTPTLREPEQVARIADLREDIYSDMIYNLMGGEWRRQYANELDSTIIQIRRGLGEALYEGEGIDDAMRRVADALGVTTDRRRGQVGSDERRGYRANFNRVQAITRTVINRQSNEGALSAYRANADILDGYEWLAAKDERTCPTCNALNGTRYKLTELRKPPAHVNCRCTITPIVSEQMQIPFDEPPREAFETWSRGFGMEKALIDFLVPKT